MNLGDRIGKSVQPVMDPAYATSPVLGYIVHDERGIIAIPQLPRTDAKECLNVDEAVDFIRRVHRR